jgi:hypothetical protein
MKDGVPSDSFSFVPSVAGESHALSNASAVRLREETRGLTGLAAVMVEERVHPLWLRAGTSDVDRAISMLDPASRGLKCAHDPRRIVEIGSGAGYRAVALAAEYPGAEILATEADPILQRTGLLNTLSYDNITYVTAAVSTEEVQYGYFDRVGAQGWPALLAHPAGPIRTRKLAQLLSFYRFTDADTLIITPDAASAQILREPLPPSLRLIAVETGGKALPADMARCYPLAQFVTVVSGDYVLLYRRGQQRLPPGPRPVAVLAADGPARFFRLENITEDGFFHLPGGGVRLHPNRYGAQPARLTLSVEIRDHAELQVSLRVTQEQAAPVRFTVKMFTDAGMVLALGSEILRNTKPRGLVLPLREHQGRCEIVFTTEMAEHGDANTGAWAEIISASLV